MIFEVQVMTTNVEDYKANDIDGSEFDSVFLFFMSF